VREVSPEVLETLRTFDTPTICNVIELFDLRPRTAGYMDARIQAWFPDLPPVVGFAATVTVRSSVPPRPADGHPGLTDQVERFAEIMAPPIVVMQDVDDPPAGATFGEIMCWTYRTFGAAGLVSSGAGRDRLQIATLGFPVFAAQTLCARGHFHILQTHVPVEVGGVTVHPNDLLHADSNGVTTIPRDIAAEVADIGADYVAAEQIVLDALAEGAPSVARIRQARAEAAARFARLRARVRRGQ
jgi:4-hydroxy-4-methyl-2-oxoglutarate aldolase